MKTTKVKIYNDEYLIRGGDSDEYIEKIALTVDKKMTAIMKENPKMSVSMGAVLTAVNMADDYFKERDQANMQKALMEDIEKKIKDQSSHIKALESRIEKLNQTNNELKVKLSDTQDKLEKAKNEFRC